jgi:outer membrane protein assembly factor BamA
MQHRIFKFFLLFAVAAVLLDSCSNTRKLEGDQMLYTGRGKVNVLNNKVEAKDAKLAEKVCNEVTFYKPNGALFGTSRVLPPFGLWTYNYLKPKGKGKVSNWFYKTFSKEPVLISKVNPEQRCRKIESDLFDAGFFNSKALFHVDTSSGNPRKAKISYFINIDYPFRISKVMYAPLDNEIDSLIFSWNDDLAIKPGDIFNLEIVKSEKRKIASRLVELGYYFFKPDYVQIVADSTVSPFRIDLLIGKSPETPAYVCHKYSIDQIRFRMLGARVDLPGELALTDTIFYDSIYLPGLNNYLNPGVITRSIQFRKGDLYSTSKHQGTIMQMNNFGIFKYVKMQFVVQDSIHHKMDLLLEASPKNDVSLNLEGFVETKSSGFSGPGAEVTLAHANLNQSANKLELKLSGGVEWQWSTKSENNLGNNSYNVGINSSYTFPRLLLPFTPAKKSGLLLSKTKINLGYEFLNNIQYYRMSSLNLGFSYQWKRRQKITNVFYPLNINLVNLLATTPDFDTIVNTNPYVKKSFEEQYIAGMKYDFIYDNSTRKTKGTYLMLSLATAGNLFDLIKSRSDAERPYTIMGNVYSQFIKASADFRFYTNTTKKGLVFRLYSGAGFSYLNSTVMPYIEQFYSGGANSIRAFAARSLGPGSYQPDPSSGIVDQTGDIKIEGNIEYRFPFSKTVLGALFLDAGNVWLLNGDENRPGANFEFNNFGKQLAVGTGAGLRFDFDFFVLRTDLGMRLRTPYANENGKYWLSTKDMFSEFLLSLAIGYPF